MLQREHAMSTTPSQENIFRGGYFVSEEAEMAAKWKMVEDHKKAKGKLATLVREASTVGLRIQRLQVALCGSPLKIKIVRDKVISVPVEEKWEEVDISKVDSDEIMKLIVDIDATSKLKADLGEKLRDLGINVD